jgi:hypothetical protein
MVAEIMRQHGEDLTQQEMQVLSDEVGTVSGTGAEVNA